MTAGTSTVFEMLFRHGCKVLAAMGLRQEILKQRQDFVTFSFPPANALKSSCV